MLALRAALKSQLQGSESYPGCSNLYRYECRGFLWGSIEANIREESLCVGSGIS